MHFGCEGKCWTDPAMNPELHWALWDACIMPPPPMEMYCGCTPDMMDGAMCEK